MEEPKAIHPDEIRKAAQDSIEQLFRALRESPFVKLDISELMEDDLVNRTLRHHAEHLQLHNLKQRHVDAYKLVAWLGCYILEEAKIEAPHDDVAFKCISQVLINVMAGFLEQDCGFTLPRQTRRMLARSLFQEKFNNSCHGIWMNGLYLSFHMAVKSYDLTQGRVA